MGRDPHRLRANPSLRQGEAVSLARTLPPFLPRIGQLLPGDRLHRLAPRLFRLLRGCPRHSLTWRRLGRRLEWKATLAKAHPSGLAPEFLLSLVERSSPRGLRPRLFLLHRRFLLAKLGEEELRAQFGSLPLPFRRASLGL